MTISGLRRLTPRRSRRVAWWRAYLAVGLLAVLAYYALPTGAPRDIVYLLVGASSVVAIVGGVRRYRPTRRLPWLLMALGELMWVIGDGANSWLQDVHHDVPFPGVPDVFYLAAYPVLGCALVLLIRRRRVGRDVGGLLDSAIVTAGLGVLSWVVLAHPTITQSHQSVAAAMVGLAYPVADILLVGLLVRLVTTPGGRTPAFRLLLLAVALLVAGDTASALMSLVSSDTSAFDSLWLCSYVLWGAAALHPSMLTLSEPAPVMVQPFSGKRMAILTVATLTAPATLGVQLVVGTRIDGWAIVVGSVILFLLVVARMNLAINQIVMANQHRDQLQADLAHQATHDSLTQLPNRARALQLIEGALHRAQRSGAIVGLLFIDLDAFKQVNDTFGHRTGDEVLSEVARRMQRHVRGGDVVARLGGDEFVVLLEPIDSQTSGVEIAQRLVAAVAEPIITSAPGGRVSVGASIGAVFNLDGATDPGRLLAEADAAAYRAKSHGRGRVEVFDDSLRRELHERADLESAIAAGLRNGEFVLHYQPVIDVVSERLQGFEALIRWHRPGYGLLSPDSFIPMAESSTLICEIDRWVLEEALGQLARWTQFIGSRTITMAVNISGRHISLPRVVDDVAEALSAAGIESSNLILEITETIPIEDLRAIQHLEALRAMGVSISIDDFGTGYNSIMQLQRLPIDSIKIDRSFLSSTHPASNQLIAFMIQAAHAFGLPVVAEGVEHSAQLSNLTDAGCDSAQGYLIARPLTVAEAELFLTTRQPTLGRVTPSNVAG